MSYREVSEIRDGMQIDWDMPIKMDDGLVLRCDVFRPINKGRYPVILSDGPYGKWLHFEDGYKTAWNRMEEKHPSVTAGSTNKYQSWEVCDPEKWVPDGYVCVRVDSRGCGRSPGYVEHWSPRETQDFFDCIEWAGVQPWSNGKVGLSGISYYAVNQWKVASLQPKHLAAICVWEGFADFYRELSHNGGIYNTFAQNWYDMQVKTVQYGLGTKGHRSRMNGDWVSGPETLPDEEMGGNRYDLGKTYFAHPIDDDYYKAMFPDWSKVKVPLLSAANWGGQPLHPRGNFEGFFQSASKQKWLEVHGIEHWTHYYTDYGVDLQKRFFGYFLKGEKNGWDKQPRVQLNVRHPGERFVIRHEDDWPIPRTQWTKFHLASDAQKLATAPATGSATVTFDALGDGVTFLTEPMREATEITGPVAAKPRDLVVDGGRRPLSGAAGVRARHEGDRVPGRARPAHADRTGLAARLASQARQEAHLAVPALSHPRREAAAQARRGLRARHRDRADLHRRAEGLSRGAERARARLRLSRRLRRQALQHEERVHRLRPLPARRPARPADRDLWRQDHDPSRRRAGEFRAAADHSRSAEGEAAEIEGGQDGRTRRAVRQVDRAAR